MHACEFFASFLGRRRRRRRRKGEKRFAENYMEKKTQKTHPLTFVRVRHDKVDNVPELELEDVAPCRERAVGRGRLPFLLCVEQGEAAGHRPAVVLRCFLERRSCSSGRH